MRCLNLDAFLWASGAVALFDRDSYSLASWALHEFVETFPMENRGFA
jgi:hypothetical protein